MSPTGTAHPQLPLSLIRKIRRARGPATSRRPNRRRVGPMDMEYPGFGEIVVAGVRFESDVVVERGRARTSGQASIQGLPR